MDRRNELNDVAVVSSPPKAVTGAMVNGPTEVLPLVCLTYKVDVGVLAEAFSGDSLERRFLIGTVESGPRLAARVCLSLLSC